MGFSRRLPPNRENTAPRLPSLRGRVLAVVSVVALLLLSLTGLSVWLVQQAALERARVGLVGQARTLAASVDHEFLQSLAMLRTLAGSESLARGEMDRFERELQTAAQTFHGTPIGLIGPDGAPLSIMIRTPGQGPMGVPNSTRPDSTRPGRTQAQAQAQPTISNLIYAMAVGGPAISLTLPVFPPGTATPSNLLATTLPRERLAALVGQARIGEGLTGVLFDREMRFVARTGDDGTLVGQQAPLALRQAALRAAEGALPGTVSNVQGQPVVVAFARAGLSGYVAAASVPADAFAAPFRSALWQVAPIGATITATGLMAALLIGRRLGRTIGALSALGRGEPAAETGFREVEEVAATLRREAQQRRVAEEHQAVLVAELNHRVKNMLASVQSVADQTLRSAGANPHRFAEDFRGRLRSLARAHDLLTQVGWAEATLDDVLAAALAPWQGTEQPIRLEGGGPIIVSPRQAQALVLALHELSTNAAKYGALSVPGGVVRLRRGPAAEGRAEILWREVGGPRITGPPARRGFGTRLLERGLPTDLGQAPTVTLDFAPEGLVARIVFRPAGQPKPAVDRAPPPDPLPAEEGFGAPAAGLASIPS